MVIITFLVLLAAAGCGGGVEQATSEEHAERMATEHAGDAPVASGAATAGGEPSAVGEEVAYATVDGRTVSGYLAFPESPAPGRPGLIVIHEWWGLNDNIRTMTRRLADAGFVAFAVDLYGGEAADSPEAARELMQQVEDAPALENLGQAIAYLERQEQPGRVGVIGWCFGGGWSLQTAMAFPDRVDAAVIYYGHLVLDPERLARLDMPILGHFGEADEGIPVDEVREFERQLAQLDAEATIHLYPGADHAFANPSGNNYEPEAAEQAWQRTVEFLRRHLAGGER